MSSAEALQTRLATMHGRRFCVLTGNGTMAIALALRAIAVRLGTGEVLVPSIACPSIPQVIQYSGFMPRYVDVSADFTVDVRSMESAITPKTRALLAVHIYGHASDMDAITALARAHDLPIIEDAAQSMGGHFNNELLGSLGDFGILSFGSGKILDVGGGGAVLFDDENDAEVLQRAAAELPSVATSPNFQLETLSHWQLYHGAMNYLRVHPEAQIEAIWQHASPLFADLYLHAFPPELAPRVTHGLDALSSNIAARLRRAERYHEGIRGLGYVTTDVWRRSGTIWRYSFLAPSGRDAVRLTAKLHAAGVNASNHYWSLADLFEGNKSLRATDVGARVINFWVDERATDDAIDQAIAVLR